jgi:CubicO group peptidase (beta-lactamase class C family)
VQTIRLKNRVVAAAALTLAIVCMMRARASADSTADEIRRLAKVYAQDSIQTGGSIGIAIGVVYGQLPPVFVTAGQAVAGAPVGGGLTPDSIFQIGSVTKVFTTNLLGQSVSSGSLDLDMPLASFESEIGSLEPLIAEVTLKELGDFTGGFPSLAEICGKPRVPGCIPSSRPTIDVYTGQDFAEYFQTAFPMNFFKNPPTKVSSLPAPYNYSDFSIGLLGLLLGDQPEVPLSNDALTGWFKLVQKRILNPLGMTHTFLFGAGGAPIVNGYEPALAKASVSGGQISAISVDSPGGSYASAPHVDIVGGGGHGARAVSTLGFNGSVQSIAVVKSGTGYIAPASVVFNNGGATTEANAEVIVRNEKVVAVKIIGAGKGYSNTPTVTIKNGRKTAGTDATAIAHLVNGQIAYVEVTSGGSGYVPPLAVIVDPGSPAQNAIPVWAPAGALSSSMSDMVTFTAAAIGNTKIGMVKVPAAVTDGFAIAETPYACSAEDPSLADCPPGNDQSALAWSVSPADSVDGVPEMVMKNGGVGGFSTQVLLMPSQDLAVVVFANSRQDIPDDGTPTAEAERIARDVMFAIFYTLL